MDSFLTRQAIFDRQQRVIAYELLFRAVPLETDDAGTELGVRQVLADSVLSVGLERILDGKKGFFRLTRELLISHYFCVLPPGQTVVCLPETIKPDPDMVTSCRLLKGRGYALALSGFAPAQLSNPLLQFADIAKVNFKLLGRDGHRVVVREMSRRRLKVVAEGVHTRKDFAAARDLGYTWFQGMFFARPSELRPKRPPAFQAHYLHLLRAVNRPEPDFQEIEGVIKQELSLVYKLLRYLNSAHFGWNSRIESIRHALVLLGPDELRKWVSLAILTGLGESKPRELIATAMVRARFCEQIGALSGITDRQVKLFLLGMFSVADAVLDRPMVEILTEIQLGSDVTAALLDAGREDDPIVRVYRLIQAYEAADWEGVSLIAQKLRLSEAAVSSVYVGAVQWADEIL